MKEFENKVVLITGSSSGIGQGAALDFAAKGASLALTGRNKERLQITRAQCVEKGCTDDKILTITADMCVEADVQRIISSTIDKFGKLDVLVNNSGGSFRGGILQENFMQAYDSTISVNVRSWVQLTQLAVPYLLQSKGIIINNSSVYGIRCPGGFGYTAYGISKAAVDQFTKTLALDLGPKGVRANSFGPGAIVTPMVTKNIGSEELVRELFASFHPIGRVGEVDDVAPVISFLASDAAKFMNGSVVYVDGGFCTKCP